ncbi:MAG: tetratricopeptide repeat protein [Oscillospiraceae bacterium]|nr:tetratricopeptide repeat protein [Oscillospiraceae bacterium]
MRKRKSKIKKVPTFLSVFIVALIGTAICVGVSIYLATSLESRITTLTATTDKLGIAHESCEVGESMVQYYRELSDKTDNAISMILMIVGIFATLIVAFSVMLAFKTPKDIDEKLEEAKKAAENAKNEAKNAKYHAEILDALNVNSTHYGELTEAIRLKQITSVIEKYPNKYEAYERRRNIYINMSNRNGASDVEKRHLLQQAMEDVKKAHKCGLEKYKYYQRMGWIHSNLKEYEKSIEFFGKSIKENLDYVIAYNNRALTYNNMSKYKEALEDYKKAIELDDDNALFYYNSANTYVRMEKYEKAIKYFNKAIELDGDDTAHYNNRAFALNEMEKYEEAIEDYNKAIKLNRDNSMYYFNRANTYSKMSKYEEALDDYNKAIELDSDDARYYNNRALTYEKMGNYEKALNDYDSALEIDPNYSIDKKWLEDLREKVAQEKIEFARQAEQNNAGTPNP